MTATVAAPPLPPTPLHGLPCPDCGHQFDSRSPRPCACPVIDLRDMPLADVKALLAAEGFSLNHQPGGSHG